MPISASTAPELDRDTFFRRAMQLAGVYDSKNPLLADDISALTDCLRVELQSLIAEGLMQKWASRTTLAIVAGTAAYSLPSTVLDVVVDDDRFLGTFQQTGSQRETQVYAMGVDEYMRVQNKSFSASFPNRAVVERTDTTVSVTFYPKPGAAGVLNYRAIRIVRDGDVGTVTLDIPRPYQAAMLHKLAYYAGLLKKADVARVAILAKQADDLRKKAQGWDRERLPTEFRAR